MTAKEMTKKAFSLQLIIALVAITAYIVARILGGDHEAAGAVATIAVFIFIIVDIDIMATVTAFVALAVANAFTVSIAITAIIAPLVVPIFVVAFYTAFTTANEYKLTKKQKIFNATGYLMEFAAIFLALQFVLPTMF